MSCAQDPVSHRARTEIEKHAEYIEIQRESMKYPHSVEANDTLGSGVIEAACKMLVKQRLKVSGAPWSRKAAARVLYLRSMLQSGCFEDAFAYRQASHHAA